MVELVQMLLVQILVKMVSRSNLIVNIAEKFYILVLKIDKFDERL